MIIIKLLQALQQNLKNIMQVRNSLQTKKQSNVKSKKTNPYDLLIKQKKRIKTNRTEKTQKSKSRSKSNNEKQNIRNKKLLSKSKEKKQTISPLTTRQVKAYNTSPILKTQRESKIKVSPVKYNDKYTKNVLSHRDYQQVCQTISTKVNTQRTPVKKILDKKPKQQTIKKSKKSNKQQKPNKSIQQPIKLKKKQKQNEQFKIIKQEQRFKKIKKIIIPQINTRIPQRKQSYFDTQILQKLNLDNAQFFRRKKHHLQQQQQQKQQIKKNNISTQLHHQNSIQYCQCGIQTDNNPSQYQTYHNKSVAYRQLQSFRKQQELKWKIVYLELNQLKTTRTPQKIQQLITQSDKNINQFQNKCKQIITFQHKNKYHSPYPNNNNIFQQIHTNPNITQYIFESPLKIYNTFHKKRKSIQQNKQLIKSLSDQKLLQQLQNLDNFQQLNYIKSINNSRQEKPSSSSFCIQFQKQMEYYNQQNNNKKNINHNQFMGSQIQHIPELEYQKSMVLLAQIQDILFLQISQQLALSPPILHSYLSTIKNTKSTQQLKISCNNTYSLDTLHRLFKYIQQHNQIQIILQRLNKPFGNSISTNLKLLRNYYIQNQQDMYQQQNNQSFIIDSQLLGQFQILHEYNGQGQYFYNHCLYSCFNQILDSFRPCRVSSSLFVNNITQNHHNIQKIYNKLLLKFKQTIKVKMGYINFSQQQLDPLKISQNTYILMDKFIVDEQQQKWKKIDENIFEQKYFLAQNIIMDIMNQEFMMLYNEFF